MNDGYYDGKAKQQNRGTLATKARWEAEDWRINLDAMLGKPEDCSMYHDCITSARDAGSRMTAAERAEARELSRNPK